MKKSTTGIHQGLGTKPVPPIAVIVEETEVATDAIKLLEVQDVMQGFLQLTHGDDAVLSAPPVAKKKKAEGEKPQDAIKRILKAIINIDDDLKKQVQKKLSDLKKQGMIQFIQHNQKLLEQFIGYVNEIKILWNAAGMPGAIPLMNDQTLQGHQHAKALTVRHKVSTDCRINDVYQKFGALLFALDKHFNPLIQAGKTVMYEPDRVAFKI